jgi:myo-inositol 2-dehydrogenase/D-chiro-inositol 1-dehydrogenase/scyllo-inositol 2-dehydrogenase (NAD+)
VSALCLAVVGAGRAGAVHARNLSAVAGAELVALVDENPDGAAQLASELGGVATFPSLDEAHGGVELDGIVIGAPTFAHRELAVEAAQLGLHVFCEKPMALTVAECDEIIAAHGRAGTVFQIGFVRRFREEFVEAARRVAAGDIGEPMVVKSLTRGPGLPPAWSWELERSNGMLAEVNSHDFDCVAWLVGSPIERVYAETANFKGEARGVEAKNFYDNAVVSLRFESGAIGTIDGTCPADYGYDARAEILGTEGLLVIGEVGGMTLLEARDRETGTVRPISRTWPERFGAAYRLELQAFADAIRAGEPATVGGSEGRAAVAAVRAANRSWLEERPIAVAEELDSEGG